MQTGLEDAAILIGVGFIIASIVWSLRTIIEMIWLIGRLGKSTRSIDVQQRSLAPPTHHDRSSELERKLELLQSARFGGSMIPRDRIPPKKFVP